MCLSVSGRLRLRRPYSKDSLQTALIASGGMIHEKPAGIEAKASYICVGRARRALAARSLGLPTHFDQLRDDHIAMIALYFDDALAHRAARSTPQRFLSLAARRLPISFVDSGSPAMVVTPLPALPAVSRPTRTAARFAAPGTPLGQTHSRTARHCRGRWSRRCVRS